MSIPDVGAASSGAPAPALLMTGEHFTDPELQSLVHHGALVRLLPGVYAPVDAAREPVTRAGAVGLSAGPVLAAGWTAVGPTAAWILTGGASPRHLHAAVPHFHRRPAGGSVLPWALVQSDVAAGPGGAAPAEDDVQVIGAVRVTTPARTVEDLLLSPDPEHTRRAARVIAAHGAQGLRERLARRSRRAGAVAARARLDMLLGAIEPSA